MHDAVYFFLHRWRTAASCTAGESAASATPAEAAEEYFDLEDLGRLRRNVRRAIENVQRERELYHEIVLQYLEVRLVPSVNTLSNSI